MKRNPGTRWPAGLEGQASSEFSLRPFFMNKVGTDPERHLISISGLQINKHTWPPTYLCTPTHANRQPHTNNGFSDPSELSELWQGDHHELEVGMRQGEEPHSALSLHSSAEALRASVSPRTLEDSTGLQRESSRQALRHGQLSRKPPVAVIMPGWPRVQVCGFEHHKKKNATT